MSLEAYEPLDASLRTARQTQDEIDRLQQQVVALQLRNFYLEEGLAEATGQDLEVVQKEYENVSAIKSIQAEVERRDELLMESHATIQGLENETYRLTDELHNAQAFISDQQSEMDRRQQAYEAELANRHDAASGEQARAMETLVAQHEEALAASERARAAAVQQLAQAVESHRVESDGSARAAEEKYRAMEAAHADAARDSQRHIDELSDALRATQGDVESLETAVDEMKAAVEEATSRAVEYERRAARLGQHNRLLAFELEERSQRLDAAVDKLEGYKRAAGYRWR